MKSQYHLLIPLFALLQACGGQSSGEETPESNSNNDSIITADKDEHLPFGFNPLYCEHNNEDDARHELPIEVAIEADYSNYLIIIDGTQLSLEDDKFEHEEFVILGDDLCLKGEFSDPNNSEKDTFKIAIGLNNTSFTYKLKIDDGLGSIRYDTLIPLTNWGISNPSNDLVSQ